MSETGAGSQRLDKWLWFIRLAKTRTLAAGLVTGGKIRVNKARVEKPSHALKIGDVITATVGRQIRIIKVAGLGVRRGPAPEARTLYEELTPIADATKPVALSEAVVKQGDRAAGTGRPTKRDRRQLQRLKGEMP